MYITAWLESCCKQRFTQLSELIKLRARLWGAGSVHGDSQLDPPVLGSLGQTLVYGFTLQYNTHYMYSQIHSVLCIDIIQ